MKTLTIRGIDAELAEKIKERATKSGESINKLILRVLKSALGLGEKQVFPIYHDLDRLAGTWNKEDEEEFHNNIRDLSKVDPELWQ